MSGNAQEIKRLWSVAVQRSLKDTEEREPYEIFAELLRQGVTGDRPAGCGDNAPRPRAHDLADAGEGPAPATATGTAEYKALLRAAFAKRSVWDAIQSRARAGESVASLAHDFGVSEEWVSFVLAPENHVSEEPAPAIIRFDGAESPRCCVCGGRVDELHTCAGAEPR